MFFSCYDRVHGYVAAVWTSCSLPASSLDLQCGSVLWAGLWFLSGSSLVTLWFLWFLSGSSGSSGSSLVPLVPLWFLWAGLWFLWFLWVLSGSSGSSGSSLVPLGGSLVPLCPLWVSCLGLSSVSVHGYLAGHC